MLAWRGKWERVVCIGKNSLYRRGVCALRKVCSVGNSPHCEWLFCIDAPFTIISFSCLACDVPVDSAHVIRAYSISVFNC